MRPDLTHPLRASLLAGVLVMAGLSAVSQAAEAANTSMPAASDEALGRIADPFEGWNRGVYGVNHGLDRAIIRPAAMAYRRTLPKPAREGVHNALANLGSPVVFFNDVLQVQPHAAADTVVRFAVNTTAGVLGVFDVASSMGVYRHRADFGQTLGRYGVGTGAYVFLPVLGPSSVRDTVGQLVNIAMDPINYARFDGDVAVKFGIIGANALDTRIAVDKDISDLEHSATDPYVTTRSIWVQNREAFIRGDKPVDVQALPDFSADPAPPAKPR